MKETGVVKFSCNWTPEDPLDASIIKDLNEWRDKLYELGLLGENDEEIGYGNISVRFNDQFIISGSTTGKLKKLTNEHYTKVVHYNIANNSLTALGPIIASSESLTHAMIYESDPGINAVLHVHHLEVWKKLLNKVPTSDPKVEYGTPKMANEIARLFKETDLPQKKILVMGGHEEGIISFGKDLAEAGKILLHYFDQK